MITVAEAAQAYLLAAVAEVEQHGRQVWWAAPEPRPVASVDPVYSWFMTLDGDAAEFDFELSYQGNADDLVPEGFADFTLFIGGSKRGLADLYAADDEQDPDELDLRPELWTEDGRPLRFVLRLPQPEPGIDWSALPDVHLRCFVEETLVDVNDPDQECPCGRISRDDEGRLLPLTPYDFVAVYEPAPEEA